MKNVFFAFTRRTLLKNRVRTLVTVIGILLSAALFTAVLEGAVSGVSFLKESEAAASGNFHAILRGASDTDEEKITCSDEVASYAVWREVGWAAVESGNEYKPYLHLRSVEEGFPDLVSARLLSGRMPENENELVLSANLTPVENRSINVGDKLTLEVGRRVRNGETLNDTDWVTDELEELVDTEEKTYEVVGIMERLGYAVENYSSPGYTALTAGDAAGESDIFFTLHHPRDIEGFFVENSFDGERKDHIDLLRYEGVIRNDNLLTLVYGFAAVLCFLIALGSISLIYNSFSISVGERTRQFGLLKSIGATKKQLRASVFYEALILDILAVPLGLIIGCVGIGVTFFCLQDAFSMFSGSDDVKIHLVLSLPALLIALIVTVLTTLVSAWVPARRAMRLSAIEAIRQSEDVAIKGKTVRTSRLTQKLLGFEGMMALKNFKRSKKRYRSTVLSLALSVMLFISASSFGAYLTDSIEGVTSNDAGVDVSYYIYDDSNDPETIFRLLESAEGVEKGSWLSAMDMGVYFPTEDGEENEQYLSLVFASDDSFRALLRENGLDEKAYFDAASPRAVIFNRYVSRSFDENGNGMWEERKVIEDASFPVTAEVRTITCPEGYDIYDPGEMDENGERWVTFFPREYLLYLWSDENANPDEPDMTKAIRLPAEECEEVTQLSIGSEVASPAFGLPTSTPSVLYPYSMKDEVLSESLMKDFTPEVDFFFKAESHARAEEDMRRLLTENGYNASTLYDEAAEKESQRMLVTVVNVFSGGFIILISLIAVANVFNTISTNVALRKRELAMLRSVGLGRKGFRRMMNRECLIYGVVSLLWGLPAAFLVTFAIWKITGSAFASGFYVPGWSVLVAVGSVFLTVFSAMLYAAGKVETDNLIDALKNETI
ncbi:MAG: ABC transporter permease [Clostridia bacterium]|nr:ABC transporter permease [Clostridia bacterium]